MPVESKRIPRIIIGAAGSGSGKTTITCGLLQALKNRGKKLTSFKCGPDYIDPMFHTEVLGVPSRNLDLFFMGENTTKYLLAKNAEGSDLAIIEGVMGYYDGMSAASTDCSTYDLARKTRTPGILLVDCKGMAASIVALIHGFVHMYEDSSLKGVILNRIFPAIYPAIKEKIEEELGITVFGYMPEMKDCRIESRHLGLITAQEIDGLKEIIERLAEKMEGTIDLDGILALGESAKPLEFIKEGVPNGLPTTGVPVTIGVAKDKAFCFYYQDNLDLLEDLGVELVPFSPLADEALPEHIQGILLGGGYPELYLKQLSENKSMRESIKKAVSDGMPCLAECGGFMYLQEQIQDDEGTVHQMVGALEGRCTPQNRLKRFGYLELTAQEDNLLGEKGKTFKGHEFHYWDSTHCGEGCIGRKPSRENGWPCVVTGPNLWAGYPHVHLYSNVEGAFSFVEKCREFSASNPGTGVVGSRDIG